MTIREVQGTPAGNGLHVGVVVADFNASVTDALLSGALEALERHGTDRVTVVHVPGAWELPLAAQRLAEGVDAVVAVGAVILGETDHYHHVATQAMEGLTRVGLSAGKPVTNAVLTVREFRHAQERSEPGPGNKGYEAAEAALAMVSVLEQLDGSAS